MNIITSVKNAIAGTLAHFGPTHAVVKGRGLGKSTPARYKETDADRDRIAAAEAKRARRAARNQKKGL